MGPKNPSTIGRYDVLDRLGHGGMGVVYRARDPRIGRLVAIKLLRVDDADVRERFLQEARSAGSLTHRNIVTIYDYGEHEGQPYIVMEFISGVTLAEQIRRGLPRPLPATLDTIRGLSAGLAYAHARGIVHRDVKPANVMIDDEGVPKILDFGIARVGDSGLTQFGMLMGTPNYMSPEQVDGRTADRRSDIFAVGLVFYELLSGRKAFSSETASGVMKQIVWDAPSPLEEFCPGLDGGVVSIVARAIQKDPSRRYQTLEELIADLDKVASRIRDGGGTPIASGSRPDTPTPYSSPRRLTPRGGIDRDVLSKLRSERIDIHLQAAQAAFDAGHYDAAAEACEQAVLIDPDEPRALQLLTAAREALEAQEVEERLLEARLCIERGDTARASSLVSQVLELDSTSPTALELRSRLAEIERRREEERQRQAAIEAALARARASLTDGRLESAIRAASEILIEDPNNEPARQLSQQALAAIEARRERERLDHAARTAIEQQRSVFAAGRWQEAIDALERFSPPHDLVTAALGDLRGQAAVLERRTREEAERRRREEAEAAQRRQAQQRWVAGQMALAASALESHEFLDAIEVLEHVERVNPEATELGDLLAKARSGQQALETERRRREETERELDTPRRRLRQVVWPRRGIHTRAHPEHRPGQSGGRTPPA